MNNHRQAAMVLACLFTLNACDNSAPPVPDDWAGRWNGVEATYLDIRKTEQPGIYDIAISDLDRERIFTAIADGDTLKFTRDNQDEIVMPGNGEQTGMKWLSYKKDCLIVKTGEGYCRD